MRFFIRFEDACLCSVFSRVFLVFGMNSFFNFIFPCENVVCLL